MLARAQLPDPLPSGGQAVSDARRVRPACRCGPRACRCCAHWTACASPASRHRRLIPTPAGTGSSTARRHAAHAARLACRRDALAAPAGAAADAVRHREPVACRAARATRPAAARAPARSRRRCCASSRPTACCSGSARSVPAQAAPAALSHSAAPARLAAAAARGRRRARHALLAAHPHGADREGSRPPPGAAGCCSVRLLRWQLPQPAMSPGV